MEQGREFFKWIPNAHIKYPTTTGGLRAAEISVKEGMRVNMTLVFSQGQAAAVYAATLNQSLRSGTGQAVGATRGQVYLSPFVGRLDDRGENGMDFILNTIKMYKPGDGHVEVLVASVRSIEHFMKSIELGADIITAPLKILKQWAEAGMPVMSSKLQVASGKLKPIPIKKSI